jgi:hypothetical protein
MTAIVGLRGTGQFTTDFRPTNYRELFTLLEPNGTAPLQALLSMANSESTDDPKFNHFRDELPDRVLAINNVGGYNNSATDLVVAVDTDLAFIIPGTVLYNTRTGEIMRATANGGNAGANTITVTRNVGGGSLTINDADSIVIAGHADPEGSLSVNPISFDPTVDFNYTQIFKTAISVSETLKNTYLRTGSKEQEQITKALKLHMSDIERAMFFGKRVEVNGSTAQPLRYTGGLFSTIPNPIDAASGFTTANVITEQEFDRLLIETIFAWGSSEKVVFAGPRVISNLMEIAKNRWQPTQVDNAYGVKFTRYTTFAGDLLIYMHPMFRQIPAMNNSMVMLDMAHVKYRYLQNRDTSLQRDIQAPDLDGVKHQYLSECGLELTQGKVHSIVRNWTAVKAPS